MRSLSSVWYWVVLVCIYIYIGRKINKMPLWGWLLTLLKGFLPFDGKRIGKIIWLIVWIILALTAYHKLFYQKQNVTKIEKIETQIINECPEDNSIIGIKFNLWKLYFKLGL